MTVFINSTSKYGVTACGHQETANAAARILELGGNAYDAIFAAHFAACVTEPVLASIGGGGFLLANPVQAEPVIYDFFTHTPLNKRPMTEIDFFPIEANFGEATQEFHIGAGSIATPGSVKGLFSMYRDLCTLPLSILFEPAIELAKNGVVVNEFQAYIFSIIAPIFSGNTDAFEIFGSKIAQQQESRNLVQKGELLAQPALANTLEMLSREKDSAFYEGDIAHSIEQLCQQNGGHLTIDDLSSFKVIKRKPLCINYRGTDIFLNPPPSNGGILIAFALQLLSKIDVGQISPNSNHYLELLRSVMFATDRFRKEKHIENSILKHDQELLDPEILKHYAALLPDNPAFTRGTTHISVLDHKGNVASLTVSNGEGCGYMVGKHGFMLNNMLGEEDINPGGFHQWRPDCRLSSMMCPALLHCKDKQFNNVVLGSGGSNRIRSAILQVIINLLDHNMTLQQAIEAPRIHFENNELNIEPGIMANLPDVPANAYSVRQWASKNLFFGGVHAVASTRTKENKLEGIGDGRRGGAAIAV